MDLLATPHVWEIYETPAPSLRQPLWSPASVKLCQRLLVTTTGALAIALIGTHISAQNFPGAGLSYIAPPPGYNVNIRSGPSTRYPAVNTLRPGTPIYTTGVYERGWAQIRDRTWVAGNLIDSTPRNYAYTGGAARAYIAPPPGYNVNIRSGPGVQYPAVNTLRAGTEVIITGQYRHGWAQLNSGAWVASNLIRMGTPVSAPPRPTPAPQPQPPPEFFQYGSRDPEVVRIEAQLRTLNYVTRDFVPNEFYGRDTETAVRNFQRVNQLPVDGIVGPRTRDRLYSANAIANPSNGDNTGNDGGNDNSGGNGSNNGNSGGGSNNGGVDPGDRGSVTVNTEDGLDALIFSGPGTEYDLLGFIENGATVNITGRTEGNWSELDDGSWIYTDFLAFDALN